MTVPAVIRDMVLSLLLLLTLWVGPADAAGDTPGTKVLRMGLEGVGMSTDPHRFANLSSRTLSSHLYEGLVARDADLHLVPSLATHWTQRVDGSWLFELRAGVRFHGGGTFDSTDVLYSLCCMVGHQGSLMASWARQLGIVEAAGTNAVLIRGHLPDPDLPRRLVGLWIVDAPVAWRGRFDLEACAAATLSAQSPVDGTGPFRLLDFVAGQRVTMARFDGHWGVPPPWDRVVITQQADAVQRGRQLATGTVDIIDTIAHETIPYLEARPDIQLIDGPVSRTFMLHLNQRPAVDGHSNPLADARVRRAIAVVIDRAALVHRALGRGAVPTAQLVPAGMPGYQADIPDNPNDLALARQLMAQAGHANGFALTLFAQDYAARVGQVVARYLQQIGIQVTVQTLAEVDLVQRANDGQFDMYVGTINLFNGDYVAMARDLLGSRNAQAGTGANNRRGYSNADMDALVALALTLPNTDQVWADLARRIALRADADTALIPLAHAGRVWGVRKGMTMQGRADGLTLAWDVRADTH